MAKDSVAINLSALSEPFPPDRVHWRVGSTNKDKTKGLALAYIDARDVMDRLDKVCGFNGWQCRYPHAGTKTCCEIGINVGDEWVWKSDGAGDTDFEGDKGAFSDAFKRAAVRWGIGRYLYGMPAEWVRIEPRGRSYVIAQADLTRLNSFLNKSTPSPSKGAHGPRNITTLKKELQQFVGDLAAVSDLTELTAMLNERQDLLDQCVRDLPNWWYTKEGSDVLGIQERIADRRRDLEVTEQEREMA